ncbi:MAG: thiamine biosynthesis protein ThiS, partial [Acidimicrobiia bacterium]|nr:thiamine biosynthesis protein ThiS [Acidimicrobiia bacterium]
MEIMVNGERRDVAEGTTIEGLLRLLEIPAERVAVELDRGIVKKG